jgi:hypothetical protein
MELGPVIFVTGYKWKLRGTPVKLAVAPVMDRTGHVPNTTERRRCLNWAPSGLDDVKLPLIFICYE